MNDTKNVVNSIFPKNYHGCRNCANGTGELEMCPKGESLTYYTPVCPFWKESDKD